MDNIQIIKRNDGSEKLNIDKIHRVLEMACRGYDDVSISDIEFNATLQFFDGITTSQIHDSLVKSASDLISYECPNYQYVGAKLLLYKLRKDAWGESEPPRLYEHIKENIKLDIYTPELLEKYTKTEILKLGKYLDHDRDEKFTHAGLQQMIDKYLCSDRIDGTIYETPQFAFMLIAMTGFMNSDKRSRLKLVKRMYDALSSFKINLPTPILSGMRTNKKQFASCILIDVDDTLDSIGASNHAIMKYTANRAGLGINVGRIRGIDAKIRGGEVIHTGKVPILKMLESTSKSCTQNAIRTGATTVYTQFWDYEIENILVLKNNAGTDENRVRKMDYAIVFDRLFFDRWINGENITLFSTDDVPEVYEAFGTPDFEKKYKAAEQREDIRKKTIPAEKLLEFFLRERIETARIYCFFIDNEMKQGAWKLPVRQSNLCLEICHPNIPINHIDDKEGEIGTCVLSAVNVLETKEEELEGVCDIIVRFLDELIDYQDYPLPAGENFTKNRRSLGIGITNYAAWLVNQELYYTSEEAAQITDELWEKIQYYLLKASNKLAQKKGKCAKFDDTKYSDGSLPIDRFHKNADQGYKLDWESLRKEIKEFGLRHSTLTAQMPCESCLKWDTKLVCEDKSRNFHEIADMLDIDYNEIESDNANIGWYFSEKSIDIKTKDGVKKCNKLYYNGFKPVTEIELEDGTVISATEMHKFLVNINGKLIWKRVYELVVGDAIVQTVSASWLSIKITKINRNTKKEHTWDIEVPDEHNYLIEDNLISHNSSVSQNSTNGVEPIRDFLIIKESKTGFPLKQVVPFYGTEKEKYYQIAWDIPNTIINRNNARMQKWIDMAISTNHNYENERYENEEVPMSVLANDFVDAYKQGLKTIYYANTKEEDREPGCESGACSI